MPLAAPKDLEENDNGVEGSPPAKRSRCSCTFDGKPMQLLEEMQRMLQRQNDKIESMCRENQELREKVSILTTDKGRFGGYLQQSPSSRMLSDKNCSLPLQLRFLNSCGNDKYSRHKIEADDKTLLKVAVYDHNNKIITCEPFSSMRVLIVAIHGDFDDDHKGRWTEEYSRSKIVTGRPGKEHLLFGNLHIRLKDGVGYLSSAKFQDNSSFIPSKRFKLGVMADDERICERIQEGITESFAVKDVRGFSTKKSCIPSPHDAVYKLSRIAMNGDRHKSLEQNGIKTVEDLLCSYSKSPDDLRKIMGKISGQDWDKIITHAHKSKPRAGIHYSCIKERNVSHEHEHEPFFRSNDSYCLKGSSTVQPNPTIQKQLDVPVSDQQISSTLNGLSAASSQNMLKFGGNTDQKISSTGNELLPVLSMNNNTSKKPSSWHGHSLECKSMPEGNRASPGNASAGDTIEGFLSMLETTLLEDEACGDFDFSESFLGGSSSGVEHSGGLYSINEARNMSHGGRSAASEAGSVIYGGFSPASEVASRNYGKFSPSPIRKAGSVSYGGLSPASEVGSGNYGKFSPSPIGKAGGSRFREEPRLEPVKEAGTVSDASTYFRAEAEC